MFTGFRKPKKHERPQVLLSLDSMIDLVDENGRTLYTPMLTSYSVTGDGLVRAEFRTPDPYFSTVAEPS